MLHIRGCSRTCRFFTSSPVSYPGRIVFTPCIFAVILTHFQHLHAVHCVTFAAGMATGPSVCVLLRDGRMQLPSSLSAISYKLAYLRAWLSSPYGIACSRMNAFTLFVLARVLYAYLKLPYRLQSVRYFRRMRNSTLSRLRPSSVFGVTSRSCYLPAHL